MTSAVFFPFFPYDPLVIQPLLLSGDSILVIMHAFHSSPTTTTFDVPGFSFERQSVLMAWNSCFSGTREYEIPRISLSTALL